MYRVSTPSHPQQREAILCVISEDGNRQTYLSVFESFANGRLTILTPARIPGMQAVSVEYDDILFLGEVMACSIGEGGSCRVDIQVQQTLTGLQSLIRLKAALIGVEIAPAVSACR